ncbi:MAG: DUF4145 domain-containing protein [Acidobacteria bacterium]|nr:DUF4145 domain-containing protein [Acidobacteriota bacterium]
MIFLTSKSGNAYGTHQTIVRLHCPACHHKGTFEQVHSDVKDFCVGIKDSSLEHYTFGQRRCPDPNCAALIFFVGEPGTNKILLTYPSERITFDTTDIPEQIKNCLEEAITCHANNCYVAAAIMVRKTLEELCSYQNATGNNLKERIKSLGTKIVLPQELIEGLDELRLLGNDAAHIESQAFHKVEHEEVETAIEFTKEVLKATFQFSTLLNRLRALKKP